MNWKDISMQPKLTNEFIKEHKEKLIWSRISKYQTLSEDFIEEMHTDVDWCLISKYQNLSFSFIIKHKDTIPFSYLQANTRLSFTKAEWDILSSLFAPKTASTATNGAFSHYYANAFREFWAQKG